MTHSSNLPLQDIKNKKNLGRELTAGFLARLAVEWKAGRRGTGVQKETIRMLNNFQWVKKWKKMS
jgi:hypothetical protein